jgi:ribonuclease-3
MDNLTSLKKIFKNEDLFLQALTHKSWVNEHKNERGSNERLEFLGDAVLEFVVSSELFSRFPDKEEGYLTALRANLVNTQNLASLAQQLKVGELLLLSKGEEDGGGRENPSLLADTIEAIIGALFIDQGLEAVSAFISQNIFTEIPKKIESPLKDAKSRLQEFVQAESLPTPKYQVMEASGPDHDKNFTVSVMVNGKAWGTGTGKNKSIAEQNAALEALEAHLVKKA